MPVLLQSFRNLKLNYNLLQEEFLILNQAFEGNVVTSEIFIFTLSPDSNIVLGKERALKTSPLLFWNDIT